MQVNRDDVVVRISKTDTAGFVHLTFPDGRKYEMTAWNAAAIGDLIAERSREADNLYWQQMETVTFGTSTPRKDVSAARNK